MNPYRVESQWYPFAWGFSIVVGLVAFIGVFAR